MRKFFIILIITIFTVLVSEFIFFLYFHNKNLNYKLSIYSEQRKSVLGFNYFSNVDLVLPLPNVNFTHTSTGEFVDVFPSKDILNLGFGLFDDGIDQGKKVYAVAIGDSITRGVGSGNNLENGWVELIEKQIDWIDIINLGNLGESIISQKYKYDKLKKFINHDLVIYNFNFPRDFRDNLSDDDSSHYISYLKDKFDLNDSETKRKIDELSGYHGYKPHLEYFMKNEIKFYTIGFVLKFIEALRIANIVPENFLPDILTGQSDVFRDRLNSRMGILSDDILNLNRTFKLKHVKLNGKNFRVEVYKDYNNINLMDKVIKHSANLVNNLFEEVNFNIKHKGIKFIHIIHPSRNAVYFPIFSNKISKDEFIDYSYLRKKFKSYLNKEILILDLTDELIKVVEKNPNLNLYWEIDGHYTVEGYKLVSEIISDYLSSINNLK